MLDVLSLSALPFPASQENCFQTDNITDVENAGAGVGIKGGNGGGAADRSSVLGGFKP